MTFSFCFFFLFLALACACATVWVLPEHLTQRRWTNCAPTFRRRSRWKYEKTKPTLHLQMSFFGITSFGAPTPYTVRKYESVATISVADFMTSFRRISDHGYLEVSREKITELLSDALGERDPLQEDVEFFLGMWEEGKKIDQIEFAAGLKKIHEASDMKPINTYTSFRQLRDDKIKHKRTLADPHQGMRAPLTSSHEYGWGGSATTKKSIASNLTGNVFCHKPSFMSFYNEFVTCAEDGRDFVPGPTMRRAENGST